MMRYGGIRLTFSSIIIILLLCPCCDGASAVIPNFPGPVCSGTGGQSALCNCNANKEVRCENRGLISVPASRSIPNDTKKLYLIGNRITVLPSGAFETLTNLTYLDISDNPLQKIENNAFKGLYRLQELKLNGGSLQNISSRAFAHLWNLIDLEIGAQGDQSNPVFLQKVAGDAFIESPNLRILNLGNLICDCGLNRFNDWLMLQSALDLIVLCDKERSLEYLQNQNYNKDTWGDEFTAICGAINPVDQTCSTCENATSESQCQATSLCSALHNACQTIIKTSSIRVSEGQETFITKKCTSLSACQVDGSKNPSQCLLNPSMSTCVSCCMGPLCNAVDGLPEQTPLTTDRVTFPVTTDTVTFLEAIDSVKLKLTMVLDRPFSTPLNDKSNQAHLALEQEISQAIRNSLSGMSVIQATHDVDLVRVRAGSLICGIEVNSTITRLRSSPRIKAIDIFNVIYTNAIAFAGLNLIDNGLIFKRTSNIQECDTDTSDNPYGEGKIIWPPTVAGDTAYVSCPNNIEGTLPAYVERQCQRGIWSSTINFSGCPSDKTIDLKNLTDQVVSEENMNEISKSLADLTSDAENLMATDITLAVKTLEHILMWPQNASGSGDGPFKVVEVFSHLLRSSEEQLERAQRYDNSTQRLVQYIDRFAADVEFSGLELRIQLGNFALDVQKTSAQNFTGAKKIFSGKSNASIHLPKTLFSKLDSTKREQVSRMQFVYYQTDRFFKVLEKVSNNTYIDDDGDNDTIAINSHVVAASVGRIKLQNLQEGVEIDLDYINASAGNPKCVFWDTTNLKWSTAGCHIVRNDSSTAVCQCNHLTNFALLMDIYDSGDMIDEVNAKILSLVSYVGCGISVIGLILTLITYFMFRKLRRDNPSKILINLSAALLGVNLVFIANTLGTQNVIGCKISAVLLHYFLLASFTWMSIEAFYMYLALVLVFQTYYSKLILKCSLVGWGLPLLAVVVTLAVNVDNYTSRYQEQVCWLAPWPFYFAFLTPVGLILIINFIAFGLVIHQLVKLSSMKIGKSSGVVSRLRGALSVTVLLGLTWVFALFAVDEASLVFNYLFAICNSLQGLFIFIFYCALKKDVQYAWQRRCPCCPDPADSKTSSKADDEEYYGHPTGTGYSGTKPTGGNKLKAAAIVVQVSNRLYQNEKEKQAYENKAISSGDIDINFPRKMSKKFDTKC